MEELRKIRKRKVAKESANGEDIEENFKKSLVGSDGNLDLYYFQCLNCKYSLFSTNDIITDKEELREHIQKFHKEIGKSIF